MKIFGKIFVLAAGFLSFQAGAADGDGASDKELNFVPYEVLVKFKSEPQDVSPRFTIEHTKSDFSYIRLNPDFLNTDDDPAQETKNLLEEVLQRDDIEWGHLNYTGEFNSTPNDEFFPYQWGLSAINVPAAWNITQGNANVKIAVLDSGHSLINHPDLSWAGKFNAQGAAFPTQDSTDWSHGTHVGGIIGAKRNNIEGMSGICPNCSLISVKITSGSNTFPDVGYVVQGIDLAIAQKAQVINMSFRLGSTSCTTPTALRNAVTRATDRGIVVVVSAGNNVEDTTSTAPASCPNVIAVAATQQANQLTTYSGRGGAVTISAPGGQNSVAPTWDDMLYGSLVSSNGASCTGIPNSINPEETILSTWAKRVEPNNNANTTKQNCYRYLGGTSMSAAHVSGVVGLMLSANPNLRRQHVVDIIRNTASPIPGCGIDCGAGLINAYAAVNASLSYNTGPCSLAATGASCEISSIGQNVSSTGALEEIVIAYGNLWRFNSSGQQVGTTQNLRNLNEYSAAGRPCSYAPLGADCKINSHTIIDYPGIGYYVSVSAYGRGWDWYANGNLLPGGQFVLGSISRYATGPCAGNTTNCVFNTRDLVNDPMWGGVFESVYANGRYWLYNGSGALMETNLIHNVPRYNSGPCAYRGSGNCVFDARDQYVASNGDRYETVTAYGRYWQWRNDVLMAGSGSLLTSIHRFK